MRSLVRAISKFVRDESGPTAVEYAVMLALIFSVCFTTVMALGSHNNNSFSYSGSRISKAGGS